MAGNKNGLTTHEELKAEEERTEGLTYEEKRELAWELTQELLKAIPGEPELYEVDEILEEMKGFIHARAIVPKIEE